MCQHVVIFGVGSVGSAIADLLVRSGVSHLSLVDVDHVEYANIARTSFTINDVGRHKAELMAQKLLAINPLATIEVFTENLLKDPTPYFTLIESSAIVVAATDDIRVQGRVNRIAYNKKKIVVFPGLFDKGEGGEIVMVNPVAQRPCYHCITSRIPNTHRNRIEDYGINRLEAVSALNADIMMIVSAATKIVLGFLTVQEADNNKSQLREFVDGIIHNEFIYFKMTFYYRPWLHALKLIQCKSLPPATYTLSAHWFSANSMTDLQSRREICDVCGPTPLPLLDYPFVPITLDDMPIDEDANSNLK